MAAAAAAQNIQRLPQATAAQIEARQQIAAFEAALENAIRYGTQMLDQRLQASSAANMVMLAGMARARGFRLDRYGVMFDVEFPSMRRSMVWSLQELERSTSPSATACAPPRRPARRSRARFIRTKSPMRSLNVILDYSGSLGIGPEEWLTVAARESVVDRRFERGADDRHPSDEGQRPRGLARSAKSPATTVEPGSR